GSVVRATGAEVGLAYRRHARAGEGLFLEIDKCEALAELAAERRRHGELLQALCDGARHHRRRMLVVCRQQPCARGLAAAPAPLAAIVELADHPRSTHAFLPV